MFFFFICRSSSFSFFFFHAIFYSLGVELFLFFFLSFFWGPCVDSCLSPFSFLFSGSAAFCFVFFFFVFGFFFLFLFFCGECIFSLSFHRLNKPFEIDTMFLAVSLIVSLIHVDPVHNHAMNDMLWPTAPNINTCNIAIHEYMKCT